MLSFVCRLIGFMGAILACMKRQTSNKKLGLAIRKERNKLGLSQEKFAEKAGFHRTYIGHVERGEKNITVGGLLKIGKALEMSASQLLAKAGL